MRIFSREQKSLWKSALSGFLMLLALSAESVADGGAPEFLIGRLLVATPKLSDSFFGKTVIYMIEHNDDGAFGLIVNRPLGSVGVKDLFERMGLCKAGFYRLLTAPGEPRSISGAFKN